MQEQIALLMAQKGQVARVPNSSFKTPPPTIKAPTPGKATANTAPCNVQTKLDKRLKQDEIDKTQGKNAPGTEAAKLARLRRLCEKKPSGKCHVPEALHKRWLHGTTQEREALVEELEAAHWSKEPISWITTLSA